MVAALALAGCGAGRRRSGGQDANGPESVLGGSRDPGRRLRPGRLGSPRIRLAARILTIGAVVAAGIVLATSNGFRNEALPLALLATALGLGEVTAANRDAATASAQVAHDQERARIARELHDVLSHQLSAIAVQAGAARIASRDDPGVAAQVVSNIEGIARTGLIDLNRIVGALRRDATEQLDRRPQPRLDDLPDLIAGARAAGLPVDLDISGLPPSLPASVELAAYRVIQESLTNALRYAQAPTRVRLSHGDDVLDVLVEDDGTSASGVRVTTSAAVGAPVMATTVPSAGAATMWQMAARGGGRGLAGLAERAQILGGRLEAGPRPGGGFAVHAWLPVPQ